MTDPAGQMTFDVKDVQIRLATEADHEAVRDLFEGGLLEGQLRENDTGADVDNLTEGYFSDEGASGFWVAVIDGVVIGMIGVQRTREDTAEIRRLRVRDGYRRHGIGTKLMAQAMNLCHEHRYLRVILDVRIEREPAIAMFKKSGFTFARTREIDNRKMLDFFLNLYHDPLG